MGAAPHQKMVALWVDQEERDAFKTLCSTLGSDVSSTLRGFIQQAIREQTLSYELVANKKRPEAPSVQGVDQEVLRTILKRLESVERAIPKFDVEDLVRMRKEILDGNFGSMRYRVGVVESEVQSLGGSIAWDKGKDAWPAQDSSEAKDLTAKKMIDAVDTKSEEKEEVEN